MGNINNFAYVRPENVAQALDFLAENGSETRIIAGGTDLLVEMRQGTENFKYLLDIGNLSELRFFHTGQNGVEMGPLMTHSWLAESEEIQDIAPFLAQAAGHVGSVQIRNRGTVGGNIVTASPCADTVPPLIALDCKIKLQGVQESRWVSLKEFFTAPYETVLAPEEMLTAIAFPRLSGYRFGFVRLARRQAMAKARMSIAVALDLQGGTVKDARIATGSVLPTPQRIESAEKLLTNEVPNPELLKEASKQVAREMIEYSGRRWSTPYKEPVVATLTERALKKALGVN